MKVTAVDIGGANIKKTVFESGKNESTIVYFPLWKKWKELSSFLSQITEKPDLTAVTMTAELADVFPSKKEGVRFVVEACKKVFKDPLFLTVNQTLIKACEIRNLLDLAASNWLASLYLMEKRYDKGILIDVGSTTTDILPFGPGVKHCRTDLDRLRSNRLVYTGVLRTPINTVVNEVPLNGALVPVASEFYAITADVYNILWGTDYLCETPDGQGKTPEESKRRMARLLCADPDEIEPYIEEVCRYVNLEQAKRIERALIKVEDETGMGKVYLAGIGSRLGEEASRMAGLDHAHLEAGLQDAWNLPCQGLIEMVLDGM